MRVDKVQTMNSTPELGAITDVEMETIERWLADFPPVVADAVVRDIRSGDAHASAVVDGALGLAPGDSLRRLVALASDSRCRFGPLARVDVLIEQTDPGSFSDRELEAVLGTILRLEELVSIDHPSGTRRTVARCQVRRDVVGTVAWLEGLAGSAGLFGRVQRSPLSPTVLMLDRNQARALLCGGRPPMRLARRRLRRLVARRGMGIGLSLRRGEGFPALADLVSVVAVLRELAGDAEAVVAIAFEGLPFPSGSSRFIDALTAAGVELDVSFPVPSEQSDEAIRAGAYVGAGSYQCAPFDVRVPTARFDPDAPVHVVRTIVEGVPTHSTRDRLSDVISMILNRRRCHSLPRLARLVSFRGKERYFQRVERDPTLWRRYGDHLVFNWPPSEPATRVTLLDAGPLQRWKDMATAIASACADGFEIVGHRELVAHSRAEARERAPVSPTSVLEDQRHLHEYLSTIDLNAPLRPDLVDFISFLPDDLGLALEIGSSHGRLAKQLQSRSRQYVCVDIVPAMARVTALHAHVHGLVADAHFLPMAANSVDTVVANNSLEHMYDPVVALREISRVLRPGGRVYALVPLDALDSRFDLPAHLWKADRLSIELVCAAAGMAIHRLDVADVYELGVEGEAFPSCRGLVAKLEAGPG